MKKRGFFFTIDAFVATAILLITLLLMYNTTLNTPVEIQTSTLSSDFMEVLSKTLVSESSNEYVLDLREQGAIKHTQLSLLEQAVAFYATDPSLAISFLDGVFKDLLPLQYSGIIEFDGNIVFSQVVRPEEEADMLIPAKRIVFGVDDPNHIYIYIVLVKVWE